MPKKIIHHKPHENVREKNDTRDGTKQKMLQLKNTSFDHHSTVKALDKQAVDDQPMDHHSQAAILPIMTELNFTENGLLMEQEDLLAGLYNAHNTETDLLPEHEAAPENDTPSLHIDDVLSPAESDLLHALEGIVTVFDNGVNEDVTIHFNDNSHEDITLKNIGTGDYSSIQDLLDAGMDLDINH